MNASLPRLEEDADGALDEVRDGERLAALRERNPASHAAGDPQGAGGGDRRESEAFERQDSESPSTAADAYEPLLNGGAIKSEGECGGSLLRCG